MAARTRRFLHQFAINTYITGHLVCGAALLVWAALHWSCPAPVRFTAYLVSAIIGASLKVRWPGVEGNQSVGFPFYFLAILDLNRPEGVALAAVPMLAQSLWRTRRRPKFIQVAFNVANLVIAVSLSSFVYVSLRGLGPDPLALAAVALTYFLCNTVGIAGIIALTERIPIRDLVRDDIWILAYYAGGVSAAWLVTQMPPSVHWEVPLISLPLVFLVHRSYGVYVAQLEQAKKHAEEINGVHLRTIEALALAIDAKDHTTGDHLQRVQLYALEIAKELGLSGGELDALKAASVLHDIGKLAVPEHIICKPGKLTPAEFEKMKIHPVVGAEILKRVDFPYPVVPIVRSHHEKWDGSGYPDGLMGEKIPIGARILAAVDCLDALASDRQYRKALPLDEAMAKVVSEAGKSFDPAVVAVMQKRYRELEERAKALPKQEEAGFSHIRVTRGAAPAAGFAPEAEATAPSTPLNGALGRLTPEETLAILAMRIQSAVPCDAIAFFEEQGETLCPKFAGGIEATALQDLRVPVGEGMVGWVAQSHQPIINGNPLVEPGYAAQHQSGARLRSALAIPVSGKKGMAGVWALYREHPDAFSTADLASLAHRLNSEDQLPRPA